MIYENDHTDAEFERRQHAYEMGEESPSEKRWYAFCREAEKLLGFDLDGTESEDGYSLDFAHDAFQAGKSPAEYAAGVRAKRSEMGL